MTTSLQTTALPSLPFGSPQRALEITEAMSATEQACGRIAPTWPLDRFIAVNPLWAWIGRPLSEVSAELVALSGSRILMPRAWFRAQWQSRRLRAEHLREAIEQTKAAVTEAEMVAFLHTEESLINPRPRMIDVMDTERHRGSEMSWREFIVHRTSQFCAAYFDEGQALHRPSKTLGLYATWRDYARSDRGPSILMGLENYDSVVASLPATATEMISNALTDLGVASHEWDTYLTGLLLDINGWASWCSYLRWTARLSGADDSHIFELLAIRLAWEWILFRAGDDDLKARWQRAMMRWPETLPVARASQTHDWILQRAIEIAWQREVVRRLAGGFGATRWHEPKMQAVFCIDVRSEPFRRALESQDARIQTLGFAGFFGLPIEYSPVGADQARPQLPGLLAPRYRVTDTGVTPTLGQTRRTRVAGGLAWKALRAEALSSFVFVEAMGLFFAGKLLGNTFGRRKNQGTHPERVGLSRRENDARTPRLTARADGSTLTSEERCALAENMLKAMSLTREFAPVVLLVGHGSETRNNPHSAGLDCGACGGQTGEVNARAAAALLNEAEVRSALRERGIDIPGGTRFVAALHNTTTDDVTLFDLHEVPESHRKDVAELGVTLGRASERARRERAPRLGLQHLDDAALRTAIVHRSRDWSQVRPEWGLAGNAAFIAAPRERSRHLNLGGRAFLHDYRFAEDEGFGTLELIMTAPMVVAHWINFQYYASTVDNGRYGSGNKTLHNVVGGHIGVFEGNGGDLRVGLPMQSLHDGSEWVHEPLRLSVFIEAPREAIDAVLQKHEKVRALVENQWIYLFQLDEPRGAIYARREDGWNPIGG